MPVGKAYHGFTDEELLKLDRYVRNNTVNRFGPVREVVHGREAGLVLEIAFEGVQRSTRHKSGVAMRFPARQPHPLGQAGRPRPTGSRPWSAILARGETRGRARRGAGGASDDARGQRSGRSRRFGRARSAAGERAPHRRDAGPGFHRHHPRRRRVRARERHRGRGSSRVFCRHTSASLTIQENADPDVRTDLMTRARPARARDAALRRTTPKGPDDMPGPYPHHADRCRSLACRWSTGGSALGTWQGIYLIEHRDRPHRRELLLSAIGN